MDCLVTKTRTVVQNEELPQLQKNITRVVYFGASASAPSAADILSGNTEPLSNRVISIITTESDTKKVHWVAWKRGLSVEILGWYNAEDNNIFNQIEQQNVGDFVIYKLVKSNYISNVSRVRISV